MATRPFALAVTVAVAALCFQVSPASGQESAEPTDSLDAQAVDLSGNWRLRARFGGRDGRFRLSQSGTALFGLLTRSTRCGGGNARDVGGDIRRSAPGRFRPAAGCQRPFGSGRPLRGVCAEQVRGSNLAGRSRNLGPRSRRTRPVGPLEVRPWDLTSGWRPADLSRTRHPDAEQSRRCHRSRNGRQASATKRLHNSVRQTSGRSVPAVPSMCVGVWDKLQSVQGIPESYVRQRQFQSPG